MNKSNFFQKIPIIYFPLTANPIGYHHLLLAENILWNVPETKLIVFLISNGFHPDPYKREQIPESISRLEVLEGAIKDWANPEKSVPAKLALNHGIFFKLKKNNCAISRSELSWHRPVHLFENIKLISKSEKARILVGADLIKRMLNPKIFSDQELKIISKESQLQIVPRDQIEIEKILQRLKNVRNVSISFRLIKSNIFPKDLQKYFSLSSTIIRKAIQGGHNLKNFLPYAAEKQILRKSFYLRKNLSTYDNSLKLNELNLCCFELMNKLDNSSKLLLQLLGELKNNNKPHKFSILETSTGGKITESFTCLPGASNHFIEGRILYSKNSQREFLDISSSPKSSVCQKMAEDLAVKMRTSTRTDWALSETGMLGPPSIEKKSYKSGKCYLGLAFMKEVKYKSLQFNPFLTRKEHQLLVSIEAINWLTNILKKRFK